MERTWVGESMKLPPAGSDEKVQSSTHADVHNRFVGEQYGSREFIMHEHSHCEGSQAMAPAYTSRGGGYPKERCSLSRRTQLKEPRRAFTSPERDGA